MTDEIYIASPFRFSEAGRDFMYRKLIPEIKKAGFEIIDPLKLTDQQYIQDIIALPLDAGKLTRLKNMNRVMGSNNEKGIERCKGIFAVLDGTDVDSGVASEIGVGYGWNKPILGYRNDFRLASENLGSRVNLQVEYWIMHRGGEIISSVKEIVPMAQKVFGKP